MKIAEQNSLLIKNLQSVDGCFSSAAEVCSLFCQSWGETPTESPLSSSQRRKTPGQSSELHINIIDQWLENNEQLSIQCLEMCDKIDIQKKHFKYNNFSN